MKSKINLGLCSLIVLILIVSIPSFSFSQKTTNNISGHFQTEWGKMVLVQSGNTVTGTYEHDNGRLEGKIDNNVITGNWYEEPTSQPPTDAGIFRFEFADDGNSLTGFWKYDYSDGAWDGQWTGTRIPDAYIQIAGTFESEWGTLILSQNGNIVKGTYSYDEGSLEGTLEGLILKGKWFEKPTMTPPNDAGIFEFTFSEDASTFTGKWKYGFEAGENFDGNWSGTRISK